MKKFVLFLLIIALVLGGCTVPKSDDSLPNAIQDSSTTSETTIPKVDASNNASDGGGFWSIPKVFNIIGDDHQGIPESPTLTVTCENYQVGRAVIASFDDFDDGTHGHRWEIYYPKLFSIFNEEDRLSPSAFDFSAINQLIYDALTDLIERYNDSVGYVTYDISYADDEFISICFFGIVPSGGKSANLTTFVTIDLSKAKRLYLSDFAAMDSLSADEVVSRFTLLHTNSYVQEGYLRDFLNDAVAAYLSGSSKEDSFFLSALPEPGIFIAVYYENVYALVGMPWQR